MHFKSFHCKSFIKSIWGFILLNFSYPRECPDSTVWRNLSSMSNELTVYFFLFFPQLNKPFFYLHRATTVRLRILCNLWLFRYLYTFFRSLLCFDDVLYTAFPSPMCIHVWATLLAPLSSLHTPRERISSFLLLYAYFFVRSTYTHIFVLYTFFAIYLYFIFWY